MVGKSVIIGYHPVGAPTCLRKHEVGKHSQNAAQHRAEAAGCAHDDLRADKLRKGSGFRVGTRELDVGCIQETRWTGSGCRFIGAKGKRCELFRMGGKDRSDGFGCL